MLCDPLYMKFYKNDSNPQRQKANAWLSEATGLCVYSLERGTRDFEGNKNILYLYYGSGYMGK